MKPCLLTTYVSGVDYQAFIPLLVYSCKYAYPEYDIMLFLHEHLDEEVKDLMLKSGLYDKVVIKENTFNYGEKKLDPLKARSYRWLLWDDSFMNYQYLYIVDIDMFYIREPKPLHIQHSERMASTGLPFDNIQRYSYLHSRSLKSILRRIKYCHFHNLFHFLFGEREMDLRLSGLHFIDIHKFYTNENIKFICELREKMKGRVFFPDVITPNDESLLYYIVTKLGYDISKLGEQKDLVSMLDFNNNLRKSFRPHHGIHLGIFKKSSFDHLCDRYKKIYKPVLDSNVYNYYINQYKEICKSGDFQSFYKLLPSPIRIYMERLHSYYLLAELKS